LLPTRRWLFLKLLLAQNADVTVFSQGVVVAGIDFNNNNHNDIWNNRVEQGKSAGDEI